VVKHLRVNPDVIVIVSVEESWAQIQVWKMENSWQHLIILCETI